MNKPVIISIIVVFVLFWVLIFNKMKTVAPTPISKTNASVDVATKYSLSQISSHSNSANCWMIIDNKVYDVTTYVDSHPGGQIIVNGCGKDATVMYNAVGKHMGRAAKILPQYQVGILSS